MTKKYFIVETEINCHRYFPISGTFMAKVLELRFKGMDQLQDPSKSNTGEIVS